jgi:hypothetical protein
MKKLVFLLFFVVFSGISVLAQDVTFQSEVTTENLEFISQDSVIPKAVRADWETFYAEVFGIRVSFKNLVIPHYQTGFNEVVIIPKGLTYKTILANVPKNISVNIYCYQSDLNWLDNNIISFRTNRDSSYAIRVSETLTGNNKTMVDLDNRDFNGITLKENLILCLKYYYDSGYNEFLSGWTVCSGSRDRNGRPIRLYYKNNSYLVEIDSRDNRYAAINLREVAER